MQDNNIEYFSVRWREMKNGKLKKLDETFSTKLERDTFMAALSTRPGFVEITRFCDFEIIYTFPEGDPNQPFEFTVKI